MNRTVVGLLVGAVVMGTLMGADCRAESDPGVGFLDWGKLQNPVYQHPGWSVKDACMAWRDGTFYVFFSAFFFDRGQERSHVSAVKTTDFQTFSDPLFLWDGREDDWVGMCSPNITHVSGTWYLTYNSWGGGEIKTEQLFFARSQDLKTWEHDLPLARNVTSATDGTPIRAIDAAVTWHKNRYYLVWKEHQKPMMATAPEIGAQGWTRLGSPSGRWFENGEFITIDGNQHLLVTGRGPRPERDHLPYLVTLQGDPDNPQEWLTWGDFRLLDIPEQHFNTDDRANAAFLADWREHDGYFYLLSAGRTENTTHKRRGDNRLGLARSRDLTHWQVPPEGPMINVDNPEEQNNE